MLKKSFWIVAGLLIVASMALAACATPTAEVITVVETVEVEKVIEKDGETITVIETKEVQVVVTATPEPEKEASFASADPNTLVIAAISEGIDTLDPAWNYESDGDGVILNVYDQLVTYAGTKATEFVPALATDWTISDDGLTYVFNIRQGVKFHNGADLSAEDVAYSLQRGLLQGGTWSPQWLYTEPLFGIGTYDIAELVDETGALDDDAAGLQAADPEALMAACEAVMNAVQADEAAGTVTFNLATSWGPFLATLAQSWGSILDKDWAIENGTWDGDCATWQNFYGIDSSSSPIRDKTNGTGPYMLESWTPGEEKVLVKNPDWWRTDPTFEGGPTAPSIERVVIKGVSEWGTRFAMLQAGDADQAGVPGENFSQVDPMVSEWCDYDVASDSFACKATENPAGALRLYRGMPSTSRTDALFIFDINTDGGNPYIGSGELDGNGIPADFFSDVHVRKAFNYCFDWEAYIADALSGEAVQVSGYAIPGMLGYDPNGPMYHFDLDKCAEEMALAWDGKVAEVGFRLQIGYNTGNVTRQTIAQILQNNLSMVDAKYQVEIIGLPWPSFLAAYRASRLPIAVSGWAEDLHDPHNWAQPFLVGTYASRQKLPDDLLAEFEAKVSAAVAAGSDEERATLYKELTQMDYDNAIAIRLAVGTGRRYEQRWMGSYYYNPIAGTDTRYYTLTKE